MTTNPFSYEPGDGHEHEFSAITTAEGKDTGVRFCPLCGAHEVVEDDDEDTEPVLVRRDNPNVVIEGTAEAMLIMYPIKPEQREDGTWGWDYTGGEASEYDETAEQRKDDTEGPTKDEPLFQDESGEDVPISNVAVKIGKKLFPLT